MPYITYADIESLTKKIDGCANNPRNFSTTKIGEHVVADIQRHQFGSLII